MTTRCGSLASARVQCAGTGRRMSDTWETFELYTLHHGRRSNTSQSMGWANTEDISYMMTRGNLHFHNNDSECILPADVSSMFYLCTKASHISGGEILIIINKMRKIWMTTVRPGLRKPIITNIPLSAWNLWGSLCEQTSAVAIVTLTDLSLARPCKNTTALSLLRAAWPSQL